MLQPCFRSAETPKPISTREYEFAAAWRRPMESHICGTSAYEMRVGVLLRGKLPTPQGRTCIIGRMARADGKRAGNPQYFTSSLPDAEIHPSYYLLAE